MAGGSESQACNRCGCKVPAFFKVLDESSASKQDGSWLQIPPRFIQRYAARLARNAKITGPDDVAWNVVVKGDSITTIGLRKGWKTFVTAYGLKAGDLVVIRLVGDSLFRAEIFGAKTAVGKSPEDEPDLVQSPLAPRALRKNAAAAEGIARAIVNVRKTTANVRETAPAEGSVVKRSRGRPRKYPAGNVKSPSKNPSPSPAANAVVVRQPVRDTGNATGQKRKSTVLEKSTASVEKTYQTVIFVSQRRLVTEAERGRALKLAERFTSKNRFSVVVMKESHVYRGFWMGMRSDFARECLPDVVTEMVLMDSTGKEWPARWLGKRNGISGGWRKFALDHSLEEGDVCIFELVNGNVDRPVLRIHIYKVVELENERVGECRHVKVVPNKDEADDVPTQPKKKRKVGMDAGSERLEVQGHCELNKQLVVHAQPIAEREPDFTQQRVVQPLEESGGLTPTMTLPSIEEAAISSYKVGRLISRRKNKGVQECLLELEGTEGVRELKSLENGGNGRCLGFEGALWETMPETVELKVAMTCEGCVGAVKRVLGKMPGVESYDVDLKEQKVTVKGEVKPDDVLQTVSKTGKATSFWPKA